MSKPGLGTAYAYRLMVPPEPSAAGAWVDLAGAPTTSLDPPLQAAVVTRTSRTDGGGEEDDGEGGT